MNNLLFLINATNKKKKSAAVASTRRANKINISNKKQDIKNLTSSSLNNIFNF